MLSAAVAGAVSLTCAFSRMCWSGRGWQEPPDLSNLRWSLQAGRSGSL